MNARRYPGVFGGVALAIALGGCAHRPAATEPTYFEASAGEPALATAGRPRPSYAESSARYAGTVDSMHGPAWLDAAAPALDDLANAVASQPGTADDKGAEAIRAHARKLRQEATDPLAARHEVGLALAVAANAFDAAARIKYPTDAALARSIAELWSDIYPVVTEETPFDPADLYRALSAMKPVLRAYEDAAGIGGP